VLYYSSLEEIIVILRGIPHYIKLKEDGEFILLICRLVEAKIPKSHTHKVDKMSLVIEIYENLFGLLTNEENKNIRTHIQFLYDNNKIKGANRVKLFFLYLKRFLIKRYFI
jgi:hypothetical protein